VSSGVHCFCLKFAYQNPSKKRSKTTWWSRLIGFRFGR